MNLKNQILGALLILFTMTDHVLGDVITSPISVIANTAGQLGGSGPGNLIDQSGLSAGFVSGVTDFDTYIGSSPTHSRNSSAGAWVGGVFVFDGHIDFDLGSSQLIEQIALWNGTSNSTSAINSFTVFTSEDAGFGASTNVGSFNNAQNDASDPFPVSVFDLTDSTARYARLQINSHHGNGTVMGMGEIAFDTVAAVPEPATFGALSLSAIGVYYRRRRRQSPKQ